MAVSLCDWSVCHRHQFLVGSLSECEQNLCSPLLAVKCTHKVYIYLFLRMGTLVSRVILQAGGRNAHPDVLLVSYCTEVDSCFHYLAANYISDSSMYKNIFEYSSVFNI